MVPHDQSEGIDQNACTQQGCAPLCWQVDRLIACANLAADIAYFRYVLDGNNEGCEESIPVK